MSESVIQSSLAVWWGRARVGSLRVHTSGHMEFRYSQEWIAQNGSAISFSLPVVAGDCGEHAEFFFTNLLPEGDLRSRISAALRLSPGNDFALLRQLGRECAGALSIGDEPVDDENGAYEPLSAEVLARCIAKGSWLPDVEAGPTSKGVRLSLAGAQGKVPLRFDEKDGFMMPLDGAPSTHLIKVNTNESLFPHVVENEFLVTTCARKMGLKVVDCTVKSVCGVDFLLSKRYDRIATEQGWYRRLHQEDFCQALGLPPSRKYEVEFGPSIGKCVAFARQNLGLLAVNALLDWYLFNLCIGNCDAHAKNISILHDENAPPRLAPFYDLVCTLAYPGVSRTLAMACGDATRIDEVSESSLSQLAGACGVTERYLLNRLKTFSCGWKQILPAALSEARRMGIAERILEPIAAAMRTQWQTVQTRL